MKFHIELVEALIFATDNYVTITEMIYEADDTKAAKESLCKRFGVSEQQSQAMIDMRIKALTKVGRKKLLEEYQECRSRYEELQKEDLRIRNMGKQHM